MVTSPPSHPEPATQCKKPPRRGRVPWLHWCTASLLWIVGIRMESNNEGSTNKTKWNINQQWLRKTIVTCVHLYIRWGCPFIHSVRSQKTILLLQTGRLEWSLLTTTNGGLGSIWGPPIFCHSARQKWDSWSVVVRPPEGPTRFSTHSWNTPEPTTARTCSQSRSWTKLAAHQQPDMGTSLAA